MTATITTTLPPYTAANPSTTIRLKVVLPVNPSVHDKTLSPSERWEQLRIRLVASSAIPATEHSYLADKGVEIEKCSLADDEGREEFATHLQDVIYHIVESALLNTPEAEANELFDIDEALRKLLVEVCGTEEAASTFTAGYIAELEAMAQADEEEKTAAEACTTEEFMIRRRHEELRQRLDAEAMMLQEELRNFAICRREQSRAANGRTDVLTEVTRQLMREEDRLAQENLTIVNTSEQLREELKPLLQNGEKLAHGAS